MTTDWKTKPEYFSVDVAGGLSDHRVKYNGKLKVIGGTFIVGTLGINPVKLEVEIRGRTEIIQTTVSRKSAGLFLLLDLHWQSQFVTGAKCQRVQIIYTTNFTAYLFEISGES